MQLITSNVAGNSMTNMIQKSHNNIMVTDAYNNFSNKIMELNDSKHSTIMVSAMSLLVLLIFAVLILSISLYLIFYKETIKVTGVDPIINKNSASLSEIMVEQPDNNNQEIYSNHTSILDILGHPTVWIICSFIALVCFCITFWAHLDIGKQIHNRKEMIQMCSKDTWNLINKEVFSNFLNTRKLSLLNNKYANMNWKLLNKSLDQNKIHATTYTGKIDHNLYFNPGDKIVNADITSTANLSAGLVIENSYFGPKTPEHIVVLLNNYTHNKDSGIETKNNIFHANTFGLLNKDVQKINPNITGTISNIHNQHFQNGYNLTNVLNSDGKSISKLVFSNGLILSTALTLDFKGDIVQQGKLYINAASKIQISTPNSQIMKNISSIINNTDTFLFGNLTEDNALLMNSNNWNVNIVDNPNANSANMTVINVPLEGQIKMNSSQNHNGGIKITNKARIGLNTNSKIIMQGDNYIIESGSIFGKNVIFPKKINLPKKVYIHGSNLNLNSKLLSNVHVVWFGAIDAQNANLIKHGDSLLTMDEAISLSQHTGKSYSHLQMATVPIYSNMSSNKISHINNITYGAILLKQKAQAETINIAMIVENKIAQYMYNSLSPLQKSIVHNIEQVSTTYQTINTTDQKILSENYSSIKETFNKLNQALTTLEDDYSNINKKVNSINTLYDTTQKTTNPKEDDLVNLETMSYTVYELSTNMKDVYNTAYTHLTKIQELVSRFNQSTKSYELSNMLINNNKAFASIGDLSQYLVKNIENINNQAQQIIVDSKKIYQSINDIKVISLNNANNNTNLTDLKKSAETYHQQLITSNTNLKDAYTQIQTSQIQLNNAYKEISKISSLLTEYAKTIQLVANSKVLLSIIYQSINIILNQSQIMNNNILTIKSAKQTLLEILNKIQNIQNSADASVQNE